MGCAEEPDKKKPRIGSASEPWILDFPVLPAGSDGNQASCEYACTALPQRFNGLGFFSLLVSPSSGTGWELEEWELGAAALSRAELAKRRLEGLQALQRLYGKQLGWVHAALCTLNGAPGSMSGEDV